MASELEMREAEDCIDRLNEKIAALKAENEKLKLSASAWEDSARINKARADEAERALAERAGGVKGEWHRADGDKSILLYTLRQDGWRKGEAVMVNDVTVRVEAANGSESPIEPIASAILSALEPAAPEGQQEPVAWMPPQDCDGKEQSAFEKWAEDAGFDMHEHPLHYLFMDHKTAAARQGWKAALAYVRSTFTRPSEQAVTDEWREIKQHVQPRIADGYTAVAISKPGYWLVKGPGPAAALKAAMEAGR